MYYIEFLSYLPAVGWGRFCNTTSSYKNRHLLHEKIVIGLLQ
ncbi:hypothetical protein [Escherichia phage CLB_P3]|nr:hypothetical protein BPP3_35 [Escherichia phage CLB_P3]UNI73324.1 hypothetical protein [Escherichia phage CLB_P3]